MTEITHLVTNGCSWTFGQGLPDNRSQAWPKLLSNKFNIPLVNLAIPGSGNDRIHRRTFEYVFQNLPTGSKPLIVIAWSQFFRREAWYEGNIKRYRIVANPLTPDNLDEHQRAMYIHYNDKIFNKETLAYKTSLKSLFNLYNIPHIMSDYSCIDFNYREEVDPLLEPGYQEMIRFAYDRHHVESFGRLVQGFPKLPCKHDGVEAQEVIASYAYNQINSLYGEIKVVTNDFITCKDFVTYDRKSTEIFHYDWTR
jgi:hypothetical protein